MRDLLEIIENYENQGNTVPRDLKAKLNKPIEIKSSTKKAMSAYGASDAKIKKSTKKIKMAIDFIEQEKKKMTYAAIAKYAEVSPITVKKYVTDIVDNKAITTKNFYYFTLS